MTEVADGYRYSLADGKESATRVVLVRGATAGACVTEAGAVAVIPPLGDPWPGGGSGNLYLRGYSITMLDASCAVGSARAWRVELNYAAGSATTQPEEGQPGFVAWETDGRGEPLPAWRAGPYDYAPIMLALPMPGQDIGGKPIDDGGKSVSQVGRSAMLSVRNVLTGESLLTSTWLAAIGKRNSDTWQAMTTGYLLYVSCRVAKTAPDLYSVEHRIAWDADGHMRQVANTDPATHEPYMGYVDDNGIVLPITAAAAGRPLAALNVTWRQPFREFVAFSSLGIQL